MSAQETNLDNVANNLANASTTGFRKRRVQFEDMIYQNVVMPGAAATQQTTFAAGLQIGLGTRTATSEVIQLQGGFQRHRQSARSHHPRQRIFSGQLRCHRARRHTRAPALSRSTLNGNVVTADGNPLYPGNHDSYWSHFHHHRSRWHRKRDDGRTDGRRNRSAPYNWRSFRILAV